MTPHPLPQAARKHWLYPGAEWRAIVVRFSFEAPLSGLGARTESLRASA